MFAGYVVTRSRPYLCGKAASGQVDTVTRGQGKGMLVDWLIRWPVGQGDNDRGHDGIVPVSPLLVPTCPRVSHPYLGLTGGGEQAR